MSEAVGQLDRPGVALPDHAQLTFVPGELAPAAGTFVLWGGDDPVAAAAELGLPAGAVTTLRTALPAGDGWRPVDVTGRAIALVPALRQLAAMPPRSDWPAWRRPADSVLAWSVAAKLALEFVAAGRLVPALVPDGRGRSGRSVWRATPPSDGRLVRLAESMPPAAVAVRSLDDDAAVLEPLRVLSAFCDAVADACGRGGRRPQLDPRRREHRRPWAELWPATLVAADPTVEHLRAPAEEVAAALDDWASPLLGQRERGAARVSVRLEPPPTAAGPLAPLEVAREPWRLTFHLQSTLEADASLPAGEVWERAGEVIELAGRRVDGATDLLVRSLVDAARLFPPIDRALSEARPTELALAPEEVARFLGEGAAALTGAGYGVQLPPELREADARRLRARIRIGRSSATDLQAEAEAGFRLPDLTAFRYELAIGDEALSADEFAEIVATKQPLVRWRGQWVRIDVDAAETLAELDGTTGTLEITEALAAALSGQRQTADLGWVDTVASGDVLALIERLRQEDGRPAEAELTGIEGDPRPYQRRGVAWLQRLAGLGMGGVLADEMGLGKSLQAIGLLTSRRGDRPHLIVCPTSVVGNWEREINKWAPGVPVIRHHGPERPNYRAAFRPGHVTVTTYALLRRDLHLLEDIAWDVVVFDEAQQIKNAASKGARAARSLSARTKIAMTGTPIENRLSELWAIVDVTNPGLLGSQRRFTERYATPIERWHDEVAAERLRRLVAPFVMRRLKSDPDVAVELPPKHEITVHCSLTREQASLYQAAVDEAFEGKGLGTTTFERRGRILALLTALKQICNHPAQYLDEGAGGRLRGRSGKLARVTEILQEVTSSGDRALLFTQYRTMGRLLATHLAAELDLPEVPFLHGGVPLAARDAMVSRFQEEDDAPPLLLVSLRAGGTGLNLTRATEVIHYDRWWNPAVEQQATDRAHRLGQTRPVTVHTLVAAGTIEDRIAELLERKRALADSIVGEGEAWITELGDEELRELVALSAEDVEDDEDGG